MYSPPVIGSLIGFGSSRSELAAAALLRARPPPPAAKPQVPSDPMLELTALQKVDGSWASAEQLQKFAGATIECPSDLALSPSVFATVLAIAVLRKRFFDRNSQWRMIERKALRWLANQIGDAAEAAIGRVALLFEQKA
jgi:hypothetical protein